MDDAEGDADDADEADDADDEMGQRQPDPGEDEPDHIADEAQRAGADILLARQLVAADRLIAEGEEGVDRDVERRPPPGNADDRDEHDQRGDEPADAELEAAEDEPEDVEEEGHGGRILAHWMGYARLIFSPYRLPIRGAIWGQAGVN